MQQGALCSIIVRIPFLCAHDCSPFPVQGNHRRRTGPLALASEPHSEGLQALARLYCSSKQRLGYVPSRTPGPLELGASDLFSTSQANFLEQVTLKQRICSTTNSAADVLRGTVVGSAGSFIMLKSSNRIDEEFSAPWPDVTGAASRHTRPACSSAGLSANLNTTCYLHLELL